MGLSGCYGFVKFLFVLINLLIWILGIVVIGLAVWMIADPTFYLSMTQEETKYYAGLYIFLAAGAILVIVAFLGCCGAVKESQCLLVSFFCIVLIGVVAQVAAAWWGTSNSGYLQQKVRSTVETTIRNEYDGMNTRTIAFDAIQKGLKCCGATGPQDWEGSLYSKNEIAKGPQGGGIGSAVGSAISTLAAGSGITQPFVMPASCCNEETLQNNKQACELSRRVILTSKIDAIIHNTGCVDRMLDALSEYKGIVLGVGIGVAVLEILSLIFALTLCCAIDRSDRYKA